MSTDNNDIKRRYVKDLLLLSDIMGQKLHVLEALDGDTDTTGLHDLHDQLIELRKLHASTVNKITKCLQVIPNAVECK